MDTFRFGMRYWKRYLPLSVLSKICSLIAMLCDISLPLLDAVIIDYILAYDPQNPADEGFFGFLVDGRLGEPATWELFGWLALVFVCVFLCRILFLYIKNVTFQWCGLRMECDLREKTYTQLLTLDGETISRYNMGELLTTMNRDTIIFKEMYSRIFMNIFDSTCMLVFSVCMLASFDYRLLFIPVAVAPFFIVALVRYLKRAHQLFRAIRESYSRINLDVQENIDGVRIVRSFAGEDEEMKKFDECNRRIYDLSMQQVRLTSKYDSIFLLFQQIGYVGTIIVAIQLVLSMSIAPGALTASTTYVTKFISHITQISRACFQMQNQLVSGSRLKKFLTEEGAVHDTGTVLVAEPHPHIALQGVGLVFGEKQVLKNIDLDLPYGKKLGVMGGTGSGKSALLKSLSRIFDVTSGSITINGRDIREFSLETVRAEYAYVFQDVFLFSNTIDANIAFARPDCDEQDVYAAAETAQASTFIARLDEGYNTIVGERGMGLSGGQKQRISIARAVIKGAPVLILDDASSALDMATERRVLTSLKRECPDKTVIIATHRVSSVMDCDEIIYLRDGEIIERGTAQELIAQNGVFAAIWRLQESDGQLDDSSYGKGEI